MENFHSLGLPEMLMQSLNAMQFCKPTPIQAEAIPFALEGEDILGSAQTGTGKTGAYGIPLVTHLIKQPSHTALVLVPTRELAIQVSEIVKQLIGKKSAIKATLLIGGEPIGKQLMQLKQKPRVIVGTPGRVFDHLKRGALKLNNCNFLVFDETDRMLDMGFSIQLEKIVGHLPKIRQTLMFSATMPKEIIKIAESYLQNAKKIAIGSTITPIEKIKQEILRTSESEKYELLVNQLEQCDGSFIVFVKTKISTEKLAKRLRTSGYNASAIHGDLRQRNREQVIKRFKERTNRVLVATDIAARGLDIPHIECVINYDLPMCPEDYIHRIGRTGRAGSEGKAVSLVTAQDNHRWRSIHKMMNPGEQVEPDKTSPSKNKKKRFGKSSKFRKRFKNKKAAV